MHPDDLVVRMNLLTQVVHYAYSPLSPLVGFRVKRGGRQHGQAKQAQKNVIKNYLQKENVLLGQR